jgi:hypothetical protein
MINLCHVGRAVEELEWVAERGARVVYLSTAPASGFGGRRSIALPEFDPFWDLMEETGIVAGFHQIVNRRYPVDVLEMNGTPEAAGYFQAPGFPAYEKRSTAARAFQELTTPRWQVSDFIASMIGHGCLTRHPRLKVAIVEFFTHWLRPMLEQFERAYDRAPMLFDENPLDVVRRNVFIHLFHDPDPIEAVRLLGVESSMWGSDFPHPEGLRDPLAFTEEITSLSDDDQRAVMGGNLARLLGVS